MNTPIADFVKKYANKNKIRAHMPGHKGAAYLGIEALDITEVSGADALYLADGIINESEGAATDIFGSGLTVYSTEGSSQCIKSMLNIALCQWKREGLKNRPYIIALRNCHSAFLSGAALLDLDVCWIYPKDSATRYFVRFDYEDIICQAEKYINEKGYEPIGLYATSPDYIGNVLDVGLLANLIHSYNKPLIIDNAHGAYLAFINCETKEKNIENKTLRETLVHPLEAGADMCCDSAHKTLPVLTGGAYLHLSKEYYNKFIVSQMCAVKQNESVKQNNNESYTDVSQTVNPSPDKSVKHYIKSCMLPFGSTSPSYLILQSLDLCNRYIADGYRGILNSYIDKIYELKNSLKTKGWNILDSDPLKLVINCIDGIALSRELSGLNIECEYADQDYLVMMLTPESGLESLKKIEEKLDVVSYHKYVSQKDGLSQENNVSQTVSVKHQNEEIISIREALFAPKEIVPVNKSLGRICGAFNLSCPPALLIAAPGERIKENHIAMMKKYNIETIDVILE